MATETQRAWFISAYAPFIMKWAKEYGYPFASPIIAQAMLESDSGTSELAQQANNLFGLKYSPNRCPTAIGSYIKAGSEQNADGSYTTSVMQWMKFPKDTDAMIRGYFDFLDYSPRYANLKTAESAREYLELIRLDGYATSLNYVNNVWTLVERYNLTAYDLNAEPIEPVTPKYTFNIHAGHNPDGMPASGAVGYLKESTVNREVKELLISKLRKLGHTVYDCTCDNGTSVLDVLQKICSKANEHTVDLDISIHFNSAANETANGTEVLIYSKTAGATEYAQKIVDSIASLGFADRGVKERPDLYYLRSTKNVALLIECLFVSSKEDCMKYDPNKLADAIVKALVGESVEVDNADNKEEEQQPTNQENEKKPMYRVVVGKYRVKENAEKKRQWIKNLGIEYLDAEIYESLE